jgi:MFS family permease
MVGAVFWGLHMGFTQGLLVTFVADTAPMELRGTAFGVFNFAGGVATLIASVVAGALWDAYGHPLHCLEIILHASAMRELVVIGIEGGESSYHIQSKT